MKDKFLIITAIVVGLLVVYYFEFHSGIKKNSSNFGIEYGLVK
jgi:hypothetical protein